MTHDRMRAQSQVNGPARGTADYADTVPPRGDAAWRVSSRSNGSTSCVEATSYDGLVAVRNSTDPTGPMLVVSASGWLVFLDEILAGRVDSTGVDRAGVGPFTVHQAADGAVELTGQRPDGCVIRFTQVEWMVFIAGVVHDREFTLGWLAEPAATQYG